MWMHGPFSCRCGSAIIKNISEDLDAMKSFIPSEFARKSQALSEVKRWKATEYRLFLLYTGPAVLLGKLSDALYKNFMLLSIGIYIMLNPKLFFHCTVSMPVGF